MMMTDTWKLLEGGKELSIERSVSSPRGNQKLTMVFDKR